MYFQMLGHAEQESNCVFENVKTQSFPEYNGATAVLDCVNRVSHYQWDALDCFGVGLCRA